MKRQVFISAISWVILICVLLLVWMFPALKDESLALKIIISIVGIGVIIKDIVVLTGLSTIVKSSKKYKWRDRKRTFLGLPLSFTEYKLTDEKLKVEQGLLNTKESEIRLYRIMDLDLSRTFGQKIFGLGTITVHSSDKTDSTLHISNIKNSSRVKELISDCVEAERVAKRVSSREIMADSDDDDDCECCNED